MNRKTVICVIIALLLISAGAYFYAFVKSDAALYDTAYTRSELIPGIKVCEGRDFELEFDCDRGNLTGVKVFVSCAGAQTGSINYSIEECAADGAGVTGAGSMKLSKFKSGKFTFLDIDTVKSSAGSRYKLVISCGNSEENAAVIAVTPDENAAPAVSCTYTVWDLQTMIVFIFMGMYLVAFVIVLVKMFRR